MEDGTIVLVGATTENPSFELNAPLLSRARVLVFKSLDADAIEKLLARAEEIEGKRLPLDAEARTALIRMADGDGRASLTLAEEVWRAARQDELFDSAKLQEIVQRRAPIYDKAQDGHYNLISALHKSVRGSDPDAALYYLCRMLDAGEPPLYIARRVVRMAIEDIGLADPQALVIANAAKEAYDFLGSPEGELAIAQAVIYVATAPKSNAGYAAYRRRHAHGQSGRLAAAAQAHPQRADQADAVGRLRPRLRLRPRYRRGVLRAELFPGRAAAPAVLQSARTRLRARDQEAPRLLGEAAQGTGRGMKFVRGRLWLWLLAAQLTASAAADSVNGRWALDESACTRYFGTAAQSPLIVSESALRWSSDACRIERTYKTGDTVHIQAKCWGDGRREVDPGLAAPARRAAGGHLGPRARAATCGAVREQQCAAHFARPELDDLT